MTNMLAAFVHDHVFRLDAKGDVYSPGRLPYTAFKRYLDVFDEVVVIARAAPIAGNIEGLQLSSGPRLRFCLSSLGRSRLKSLCRLSALRWKIGRQVSQVDVAIVRLPSHLGIMAVWAARAQGKPLAAEVVGLALEGFAAQGSRLGRIYGQWMEGRCRSAVAACDYAIYVTDRFLQDRYPCSGVTASASNVVLPERSEAWLATRLARIANEDKATFVLGFVGSLSGAHKGLDLAFNVVADLSDRGIDVRLKVAGDGDQSRWRQTVSQLGLTGQIDFLGPLSGVVAVTQMMRDIDLLLHPSRSEGLPRAVIEAMWVGCPIVSSDAGGTHELLDQSCMHEVDNAKGLGELVFRMLEDSSFRASTIKRNWDYSGKFELSKLDSARAEFWESFARSNKQMPRRGLA